MDTKRLLRWTTRRRIVAGWLVLASACAAVVACGSGPDLSRGLDVEIAHIDPTASSSCFGCAFISGFARGEQGAYVSIDKSASGGNAPALASLDFSSGGAAVNAWPPSSADNAQFALFGSTFDMAASGDGTLYWAGAFDSQNATDGGNPGGSGTQASAEVFKSSETAFATPPNSSAFAVLPAVNQPDGGGNNLNNSPLIVGMVADTNAVYVAYSQTLQSGGVGGGGQSPDSPAYPNTGSDEQRGAGIITRVDRTDPPSLHTLQGFYFLPGVALHVLAQNRAEVFWPDYGPSQSTTISILHAPKATFGTVAPASFVAIENKPGTPSVEIVGVAANEDVVVWSASQEPGKQGGSNVTGCQIWVQHIGGGSPTALVDSFSDKSNPNLSCNGLAVDDTYAYVAITSLFQSQNGGGSGLALVGNAIGRVPLAGGKMQTLPLQSQGWYGPRRVFIDSTYVYAIDPSFVARFQKTDFPQ